jgi:hypothetical protein
MSISYVKLMTGAVNNNFIETSQQSLHQGNTNNATCHMKIWVNQHRFKGQLLHKITSVRNYTKIPTASK